MLSIKESFRYKNFIGETIESLLYYISDKDNAVTVTEKHYKSKSNPDVGDEQIDKTTERKYNCRIVDIVFLTRQLVDEQAKLSNAIKQAKKYLSVESTSSEKELDLDAAVEYAKINRQFADYLKELVKLKSKEGKRVDTDYKFNVEGNQVSYRYNVDIIETIDFDRDIVNIQYKRILEETDKLSINIESAMLKEIVEYAPIYGLHDSIEEIIEKYLKNK